MSIRSCPGSLEALDTVSLMVSMYLRRLSSGRSGRRSRALDDLMMVSRLLMSFARPRP